GRTVKERSRKVREDEHVRVEDASGTVRRSAVLQPEPAVEVPVVWSDDQVIVVDKPAGLVVHPGAGTRAGTLVQGLLARYPDLGGAGGEGDRPGIVHRLDKGTSGLLVVARSPVAFASLSAQMAARTVGREYLALVAGQVESDEGMIDAPLGRSHSDPTKIRVQAGGRQARTEYIVVERFSEPSPSTLVSCRLQTGRTHQIRVHFASIGHPVIGDERYGSRKLGNWEPLPYGRPFLHAARLEFDHPTTGERMSFQSALPADLALVLGGVSPGGLGDVYC
ncbi:MAG TPA: RluA family pseudouridine synthase, partial [Acidimicrobiales bacterium]|nr:RluA family pseudouridine synthase [Acidimicrobiales bacterium]